MIRKVMLSKGDVLRMKNAMGRKIKDYVSLNPQVENREKHKGGTRSDFFTMRTFVRSIVETSEGRNGGRGRKEGDHGRVQRVFANVK